MLLTVIVVMAMLCIFIGIEASIGIITLLILIAITSQAPILLVLLAIPLIARLLTKKRK